MLVGSVVGNHQFTQYVRSEKDPVESALHTRVTATRVELEVEQRLKSAF